MGRYSFNKNIFDEIDTEEKAYWLGFLWSDGTVAKRVRNENNVEYAFKIDLMVEDIEHIQKLKSFLESTHPIKVYKSKGFNGEPREMARLHISNRHLGQTLYHKYGLIPHRSSFSKTRELIPNHLFKHFIRGVLDADGCLVISNVELYKNSEHKTYTREVLKLAVNFSTYEEVAKEIQLHLHSQSVVQSINKTHKRHENGDAECVALKYSGNQQCKRIATYLYEDAKVFLQRKYDKYLEFLTV